MKVNIPIPASKILVQLSGGKDSVACLCYLKNKNVNVEAVHFVHEFGYELPTTMAEKVCEVLGVPLHIIDITNEIKSLFLSDFNQRPCRYCKSIMDGATVKLAVSLDCKYICVGDTKDDTMLLNRIKNVDGTIPYYSRYFNPGVELPDDIEIFRPFIEIDGSTALSYVMSNFPFFKRVNDTGDKYFEYSREGCPLQFKDLGICYTEELMRDLLRYNSLCSTFASERGIKAAIHLPSEFIVTIPKGHEEDCRNFLISNGCHLTSQPNFKDIPVYNIVVKLRTNLSSTIFDISIKRFVERCGLKFINIVQTENTISGFGDNFDIIVTQQREILNIVLITEIDTSKVDIKNIIIEIFHSYRFSIISNKI